MSLNSNSSKWITCTLGDIVTFKRGYDLPKDKMNKGIYPVVGSNGIIGYHDEFTTKSPGITIGRSGNVGKPFIVKEDSWSHNTTLFVEKFKNVDPYFVYYYLKTIDLKQFAGGSAVPTLNRNHIHSIDIRIPEDIIEQKKIRTVLLTIDEKISVLHKINNNLDKIIRILYNSWFVNFSPFQNKEFKDTYMGKIPKGWEIKNLNEVCDKISESYKPDSDEVVLIQTSDVSKGKVLNHEKVPNDDYKGHFKYKFEKNDILYTQIRPKNERYAFINFDPINYVASTQLMVLRSKPNIILPYILYLFLTSKDMIMEVNLLAESRSGTFPQINFNEIKHEKVIVAPFEVYQDFWNIIKSLVRKKFIIDDEIIKLTQLRDTLLPKLMSGEIDVSKINYDLKNMITNFNIISSKVFNRGINMKTKIISKIQNQMKPYLNQGQYIKLTNILLNSLQDIDVIDNNNDLSEIDNFRLLKLFLSAKEVEGCSEKTIFYYKSTIEKMLMKIKKQIYNINTDDLRKYLYDYKYNNKSSKTTIDNIRRIFSSFFAWLEEEDYIIKNPVRRIHRVKTGRVVKETLTDENLEVLRDNCEEIRDLAIVELLISTGIRVGELVRLNINDIDFYERECIVFGKGESERVVYFDARTKIHLIEYLQSRVDENPALFVSLNDPYNRLGISGVETRLRELGKKCNIDKVHPHKFRRTMATNAIDKGMPIEQVQKLLGHLQIDTTMQYAMVNQSNVKLAHRKFIG